MIDAVVLAGGVDTGEIAAETGIVHRPLLEVAGQPIVRRVLAALRGSSEIGRVTLVAPAPVQAAVSDEALDRRTEAGVGFVDSLAHGIEATAPEGHQILALTGDLPLITPAAINDFVRQSIASRADLTYPIIPRDSMERRLPGARRTYVRLREGTFTGGNGVVLTRDFVQQRKELIASLYEARKHPVRLAALLGLGFVIALLAHRLTIPQLEARATAIVGGRVAAIITSYPEMGHDVDKLSDLYLARRLADSFDS
jgi:GTP:adenosylcobinamide-phosphate guanylyltransferase